RPPLHRRIASAIVERTPSLAETRPEILAHHYRSAGELRLAGDAWRRAGKLAAGRGALVEAERHFRSAAEALESMEPDAARNQLDLAVQLELGQVSIATHGYTAPETRAAYERARALIDLGDPRRAVQVLSGLYALPLIGGELRAARAVATEVMVAAKRDGAPARLAWAHHLDGVTSYHLGDLERASRSFANASALYRESDYRSNPQDPGAESLDYAALTAWQLGYSDTARSRAREALALADRLGKPYAIAHSRFYAAFLSALMWDREATREQTESLRALARERNIPHFLNAGEILRGWSLDDDPAAALNIIRDGLDRYVASGSRLAIGIFLALMAEVQAEAGLYEDARHTIDDAIDGSAEQVVDMPFLFWLKGELTMREKAGDNAIELAERCFKEAIGRALAIGALGVGLRSATSLARLLHARGFLAEARSLVADWYGRMREGFDTADARAARGLLESMA
ncbi:MAG TPA: hypothetical protein VJ718_05530, partial [Candidatus Binataceae bacterium]|nr:hypothetical protein [Candidatus Binataceae bacterium]